MSIMDRRVEAKCHAIIHASSLSAAAVGAGLAQLPCSDNLVITPIQLSMTVALGRVFGIELTESAAYASIVSVSAAAIGRAASQVAVGWFPIAGNVVNACTALGLTETIGWLLVEDFAKQSYAAT